MWSGLSISCVASKRACARKRPHSLSNGRGEGRPSTSVVASRCQDGTKVAKRVSSLSVTMAYMNNWSWACSVVLSSKAAELSSTNVPTNVLTGCAPPPGGTW